MSCVPPARSDDAFNRKSLPVKGFLALLLLSAALVCAGPVQAQRLFTISGVVLNKSTKKPVDMAVITLPQSELWAVANNRGEFTLKNVPGGESTVGISCLGYITQEVSVVISRDVDNLTFYLDEDNLAIEGVVVTARENQNSLTTSRTIDRTAMDHMQLVDVADISALLPGGVSVNPDLMGASQLGVRQYGGSEKGFGTAIEVDGVRMSNNADFNAMQGLDMRNIASANVASIEVITGVPSVEYGDIATGVVKIHTQKGRTPYMVSTTLNPKLKQFALNKGFDLGGDRGVLNFSIERAQSVKDLPSPYEAYDRNTATLNYSNTFNLGENRHPLRLSVGLTGNIGGRDKKDDPDIYTGNFEKVRDNNFRANTSLNWLLNKSWITSLEFSGSVSYSDKFSKINTHKSNAGSTAGRHGMEEGYFIAQDYETDPEAAITLIPAGEYYELALTDDKPISCSAQLKLNWVHRWGGGKQQTEARRSLHGRGQQWPRPLL